MVINFVDMKNFKTKTIICLCTFLSFVLSGCDDDEGFEAIPLENVTDGYFKQYLLDHFDTDNDGIISVLEAEAVTELGYIYDAVSLDGIQYFTNLKRLICHSSGLQSLDLGKNLKLEELDCSGSSLTSLILPKTSTLTVVNCSQAFSSSLQEVTIDFTGNPMLKTLNCSENPNLKSLDLSKCTALNSLDCFNSSISVLDLSHCRDLKVLRCSDLENITLTEDIKLDELDISNSQRIKTLDIRRINVAKVYCGGVLSLSSINASGNANIKEINVAGCSSLITFVADGSGLESVYIDYTNWSSVQLVLLDLKNCKKLNNLYIQVTNRFDKRNEASIDLDISECTALTTLTVNYINSLNATGCTALKYVDCYGMISRAVFDGCSALENLIFSQWALLTSLDVSDCKALKTLLCYGKLTSLDLSENTLLDSLECWAPITEFDIANLAKLRYLHLGAGSLPSLDISNNQSLEELILDTNNDMDVNAPGLLSLKKIDQYRSTLKSLNIEGCKSLESLSLSNVESLNITGCLSLKTFLFAYSDPIKSLDLSDFASLDSVYIGNTQLQSLKVNKNIRVFSCQKNLFLTSLNFDGCQSLESLSCMEGVLSNLSLEQCASLKTISCFSNSLTSLNIEDCAELKSIDCTGNKITSLNVKYCAKLEDIYCNDNKLNGSLDVSVCKELKYLYCQHNSDLAKLIIYKNHSITSLYKDNHTVLELVD